MTRVAEVTLVLCALTAVESRAASRVLTFEQRVAAQEAIDRVYHAHRTDPSLPFKKAMPRAVIEGKVRTYLKQSVALAQFWGKPITGDGLDRELERILENTLYPDRLRAVFLALDDDPLLIIETFVRPSLVTDSRTVTFGMTNGSTVRHDETLKICVSG